MTTRILTICGVLVVFSAGLALGTAAMVWADPALVDAGPVFAVRLVLLWLCSCAVGAVVLWRS